MDKVINKMLKYNGKLSGVSLVLNKLEVDKKKAIEERDRLLHRIKQLEFEVNQQQEVNKEALLQVSEMSSPRSPSSAKRANRRVRLQARERAQLSKRQADAVRTRERHHHRGQPQPQSRS